MTISLNKTSLALTLSLAAITAACGGAQHAGDMAAHHADEHAGDSDWADVFEEVPADLGSATSELGESMAQMVKDITDVPAPGKVELKDLSPELAKHQGKKGEDFVAFAHHEGGKAISFQYVKIGVAEYDDFFRNAEETYALVYQATQVLSNMKRISSKVLGTKVEAGPELKNQVAKALLGNEPPAVVAELRALEEMSRTFAKMLPELSTRIAKLVASGEALVNAAPASITNPKVVANIGKVKEGVSRGIRVVKSSAELGGKLAKDFSSFKS